ncbi:hypothetical protein SAMN05421595_0372 [Austwickia chelonae]|uniref:Uncharacterized protein n=1 Tax=Austwickia chelonae NBRC 105200 TaxID=1184607 RepID=K6VR71_9MICO|nr:hypothetical protein [Austwickia chelonae]GAB77860.1 hypothetical protein AUCHE_08_01020 [Austwickia chelonae NBRC 105200]SEV91006.1 hypothetical protein SAMN05421595_0372 [Austwickia chelonae]
MGFKKMTSRGRAAAIAATVENWWLSKSKADVPVLLMILALLAVSHNVWGVSLLLGEVPPEKRVSLYTAWAVVISLTGTLASVSIGQYVSGRGDRVMLLKKVYGSELSRIWRGTFLGSGLAALLFLIAAVLDARSTVDSYAGIWVFIAAALLAVLKFFRLALLFSRVIGLIVTDDVSPLSPTPIAIDKSYFTSTTSNEGGSQCH